MRIKLKKQSKGQNLHNQYLEIMKLFLKQTCLVTVLSEKIQFFLSYRQNLQNGIRLYDYMENLKGHSATFSECYDIQEAA